LGEVVPVLILRCGGRASMHLAPKTCILSKGGWRSRIVSSQCVARLKDGYRKKCKFGTSNLELSIERVVVVLHYVENAARCQGNSESESHRVTVYNTTDTTKLLGAHGPGFIKTSARPPADPFSLPTFLVDAPCKRQ